MERRPLTVPRQGDSVSWVSLSRGAHEYDLDEYGLTGAQVTKSFAPYLERYGHLCRTGS